MIWLFSLVFSGMGGCHMRKRVEDNHKYERMYEKLIFDSGKIGNGFRNI